MEVELGVRMGSIVGDGLGGIGEGERCIVGDRFGMEENDRVRRCSRERRLSL